MDSKQNDQYVDPDDGLPEESDNTGKGRKYLKWALLLCLSLFTIVIVSSSVFLFFLPQVISSERFKFIAVQFASEQLSRQVSFDSISFSWEEGLRLYNLKIADNPTFSIDPFIAFDRFDFNVDFEMNPSRRFAFTIRLLNPNVVIIVDRNGSLNLDSMLATFSSDVITDEDSGDGVDLFDQIEAFKKLGVELPFDIVLDIDVNDFTLNVDDRQNGIHFLSDKSFFTVSVPSLMTEPIDIDGRINQQIDGHILDPIVVTAHIEKIVDASGFLSPFGAMVSGSLTGPGIYAGMNSLEVSGLNDSDRNNGGIRLNWNIDTATLTAGVGSLLPDEVPTVTGLISGEFVAKITENREIQFDLSSNFNSLVLGNIPDLPGAVGPFSMEFYQKGSFAPEHESLKLTSGELSLFSAPTLQWSAEITELFTQQKIDLTGSMLKTSLSPMIIAVDVAIPPTIGEVKGLSCETDELRVSGSLASGDLNIDLTSLSFYLSNLSVVDPTMKSSLGGIQFDIDSLNITTAEFNPESIKVDVSIDIDSVTVSDTITGSTLANVKQVSLNSEVALDSLSIDEESLLGLTGRGTLLTDWNLEDIGATSTTSTNGADSPEDAVRDSAEGSSVSLISTVGNFSSDLTVEADRVILVNSHLNTNVERAVIAVAGGIVEFPVTASIAWVDMQVPSLDPPLVDIDSLKAEVEVGSFITFTSNSNLKQTQRDVFDVSGGVTIRLAELAKTARSILPKQTELFGSVKSAFSLKGHIPDAATIDSLIDLSELDLPKKRGEAEPRFTFLDTGHLSVELNGVGGLATVDNDRIDATDWQTNVPFTIDLTGGDYPDISFAGSATGRVAEVSGISFSSGGFSRSGDDDSPEPLNIRISVSGEFNQLSSIHLRQNISIDQLGLNTELNLSVNRLRPLLINRPFTLFPLLGVDGKLIVHVDTHLSENYQPIIPDYLLSGDAVGTFRLNYDDQEIKIALTGRVDDLQVSGLDGTTVEDFSLNFNEEKEYRIFTDTQVSDAMVTHLTDEVLKADSVARLNVDAQHPFIDIARRENRGRIGGPVRELVGERIAWGASRDRAGDSLDSFDSLDSLDVDALDGSSDSRLSFIKAQLPISGVNFPIGKTEVAFNLLTRLPEISYLHVDLLGGSLLSTGGIHAKDGAFFIGGNVAFSGIDTSYLVESAKPTSSELQVVPAINSSAGLTPNRDLNRDFDRGSKLTGRFHYRFPIVETAADLLEGMRFTYDLTEIGSKSLNMALLALDPDESDPAIVEQRKLLRLGRPEQVTVQVNHGNMSLSGSAVVAGISIPFPPLNRFNLAALPIKNEIDESLVDIPEALEMLRYLAADTLVIKKQTIVPLEVRTGGNR